MGKGIVCDKCNNYFAREVERPFLEDDTIKLLRFDERLESKKGIVPSVPAIINRKYDASLSMKRKDKNELTSYVDVPEKASKSIMNSNRGTIIFPAFSDSLPLPKDSVLSRFLGKIALEAFALRIFSLSPDLMDSFIDDEGFDPLRKHVRGSLIMNWPYSRRRIYDAKKRWMDEETQESYQVMNEFDFLLTEESEGYFVLALFGMEYAINIAGPTIEGYERWLRDHNGTSPLYKDKNTPGHHL